jgi:hypothetical protein
MIERRHGDRERGITNWLHKGFGGHSFRQHAFETETQKIVSVLRIKYWKDVGTLLLDVFSRDA